MNDLLWIDVETTGLDPSRDNVLALGMMLTDRDLNQKQSMELVFYRDPDALVMSPFVREMHTKNGLLERCRNSNLLFGEATYDIRRFFEFGAPLGTPMEQRPYVAGSTISFDRSFMTWNWPWYVDYVHYRSIDVSTLLTSARLWSQGLTEEAPGKRDIHLPLADIEDSQRLLQYLRPRLGLANGAVAP